MEVFSLQASTEDESQVVEYVEKFCSKHKLNIVKQDVPGHGCNLYITKGKPINGLYPCLVSHMDQCHDIHEGYKVYECDDQLFAYSSSKQSQVGVGGDDACGVYACLQALLDLDNVKVALFTMEETGCNGSSAADMKFFEDCAVVCQLDRRGNTHLITHASGVELCSEEFLEVIDKTITAYGYIPSDKGLMTDVKALKVNGLSCNCFNLECGYYNPHTAKEIVVLSELEDAYNFALDVCADVMKHGTKLVHEYIKPPVRVYDQYPSSPFRDEVFGSRDYYEGREIPKSWTKLGSSLSSKASIQQSLKSEEDPEELASEYEQYIEEIDTAVEDLLGVLEDYQALRTIKKAEAGIL